MSVCVYALANRPPIFPELRESIEPVNAAAQQVEPELIASRAAEHAGTPYARPVQLSDHRIGACLAVIDLPFENCEDDDR